MIILKETIQDQELRYIAREPVTTKIKVVNETTQEGVEIDVTSTTDRYYTVVSTALSLKEGNFYRLTAYNGNRVVYLDKIFCTNQPTETYTTNKLNYINKDSDNGYITY